jgi:hypothetical protein
MAANYSEEEEDNIFRKEENDILHFRYENR